MISRSAPSYLWLSAAVCLIDVFLNPVDVSAAPPELKVEYDLAKSWDASAKSIADTGTEKTDPLVPACDAKTWATPPDWAGPPIPADQFAVPTYASSGAGPGDRPHLDFLQYGYLTGSTVNAGVFGADSYSMVAYLRIGSDLKAACNAGIGYYAGTSHQNGFISFLSGNDKPVLQSTTNLFDKKANTFQEANSDIDAIVPRDEWFQIVKVHDVPSKEVRFYINGTLALTTPFDPGAGNWEHWERDECLGDIGCRGGDLLRQVKGVGFSYFAAYKGVLSGSDIQASLKSLTSKPPPAPASTPGK